MRRRRLLAALAGIAAGSAGCVETAGDEPARTPGGEDTSTPPPTDDESTSTPPPTDDEDTPRIVGRSLTAQDGECGSGEDTADVSFDDDAVRVDGRLAAPTPCHGVALAGVRLADEGRRLVVAVRATDPTSEPCVKCLGAVPYEASVWFEGVLPAEVRVEHDGEPVTTIERPTRPTRETEG